MENTAVALKRTKLVIKFTLYRPVLVICVSFFMIDSTALTASQRQIKAFCERVGFPYDLLLSRTIIINYASYNFKIRVEHQTVCRNLVIIQGSSRSHTERRQPLIACHQKNAV